VDASCLLPRGEATGPVSRPVGPVQLDLDMGSWICKGPILGPSWTCLGIRWTCLWPVGPVKA
jgi:hypothetical protein